MDRGMNPHRGSSIAPRELRLVSWIERWIPSGAAVLDIGAGSGLLAEALTCTRGIRATLVDVVDNNRSRLALQLYDGRDLPFASRQFDVALLAFVLHHSADAGRTLREAARVAARLVILEDTYRGFHEQLAMRWTDWILNRGHGVAPAWGQYQPHEWRAFVAGAPLRLVHTEELAPRWFGRYRDPIRHLLIVADAV
jgi:ubiquinone/menaquinone biosynthesis C-methylase UbiE